MNKTMLSDINAGQRARVTNVGCCGDMRRRFMDLGLIRGTTVRCILTSKGGMKAYNIRGAVIGIRPRDARSVEVEVQDVEDGSTGG